MLFHSFIFWAFFAVVLLLYRALPHRAQNRMLLVASYVFYGTWDWRFLSLILLSTVVDYVVGLRIGATPHNGRRRALLAVSVVTNLSLLGVFKYFNFFAAEAAVLAESVGWHLSLPTLQIVLPVGISFYTFQTMSYTIDLYRGHLQPVRNFWDFALFVSFFPQLVAGPIERSTRLLPQVMHPRTVTRSDFHDGLFLVLSGLFRKVVIADNMALIADGIFATPPHELTRWECMAGVYAFALQIYGDFSGYSAMARGIAKWLGFDLMVNFQQPYFAVSPSDFWRRWHISLSTWLRDYLYIPLGGNRGGAWRTCRNLLLTMLLGGLWHGAAWTFVAWGALHGALLIAYRMLPINLEQLRGWRRVAAAVVMFHLVCLTWLLFRAVSIEQAWLMFLQILWQPGSSYLASYSLAMICFYAAPLVALDIWITRGGMVRQPARAPVAARFALAGYFVLMLVFFHPQFSNEFIYFQF